MSPTKPPRLCPRCRTPITGDCPRCRPAWAGTTRRGSTRASRKLRLQVLADQPVCAHPGCTRLATQDDHIVGWAEAQRRGWTETEWDHRDNHQGLCAEHHSEKTQAEAQGR